MDKPLAVKVRNLITYIDNARGFQLIAAPDCPYRNHIGALLTDVVLQAGLNYQHVVAPRVYKVLNDYPVAYTVNRFAAVLQKHSLETVLDWHDCEKQIRMIRILEFCKAQGIQNSYQLKLYLVNSKSNSDKFKSIRGIGDKTYDYLLKLLGVESVAVDRHVYKFVSDAGIIYKNYKEAKQIVEYAADMMQISRRTLDYSIWLYMSNKKKKLFSLNCFLNSIPIADDRVLSSDGGWELYREYDRNEFLKSIENKKQVNVKYIFKQQHTNSQEYITSLLPYAIYHGSVFVYKPCCFKYIGSRGFWRI